MDATPLPKLTPDSEARLAKSAAGECSIAGLTIREEFAARMMAAIVAGEAANGNRPPFGDVADDAIGLADALLSRLRTA
jgi:hypothetical protein